MGGMSFSLALTLFVCCSLVSYSCVGVQAHDDHHSTVGQQLGTGSLEDRLYASYGSNSTHIQWSGVAAFLQHVTGTGQSDAGNIESLECPDPDSSECSCLLRQAYLNSTGFTIPSPANALSREEFQNLCPALIGWLAAADPACWSAAEDPTGHHGDEPSTEDEASPAQVWGYGFLFVTIINLCSLVGAGVIPFMHASYYPFVMTYLIALAVGSLSSSGMLVLIPEAFEVAEHDGYLWKAMVILSGAYLFFIMERVLVLLNPANRAARNKNDSSDEDSGDNKLCDDTQTSGSGSFTVSPPLANANGVSVTVDTQDTPSNHDQTKAALLQSGRLAVSEAQPKAKVQSKRPVQSVAWMIIMGDALHNFIDGLSIGAAFSQSIYLGMSIAIAVVCEELPHELGDFAILLNAGMTVKKALFFNFLSATSCYVGLVIGISLGSLPGVSPWILAVAGGMFLYIALADMLPEMNAAAQKLNKYPASVFFLQNLGLLTGFGIITLVVQYGGEISF